MSLTPRADSRAAFPACAVSWEMKAQTIRPKRQLNNLMVGKGGLPRLLMRSLVALMKSQRGQAALPDHEVIDEIFVAIVSVFHGVHLAAQPASQSLDSTFHLDQVTEPGFCPASETPSAMALAGCRDA